MSGGGQMGGGGGPMLGAPTGQNMVQQNQGLAQSFGGSPYANANPYAAIFAQLFRQLPQAQAFPGGSQALAPQVNQMPTAAAGAPGAQNYTPPAAVIAAQNPPPIMPPAAPTAPMSIGVPAADSSVASNGNQ